MYSSLREEVKRPQWHLRVQRKAIFEEFGVPVHVDHVEKLHNAFPADPKYSWWETEKHLRKGKKYYNIHLIWVGLFKIWINRVQKNPLILYLEETLVTGKHTKTHRGALISPQGVGKTHGGGGGKCKPKGKGNSPGLPPLFIEYSL